MGTTVPCARGKKYATLRHIFSIFSPSSFLQDILKTAIETHDNLSTTWKKKFSFSSLRPEIFFILHKNCRKGHKFRGEPINNGANNAAKRSIVVQLSLLAIVSENVKQNETIREKPRASKIQVKAKAPQNKVWLRTGQLSADNLWSFFLPLEVLVEFVRGASSLRF